MRLVICSLFIITLTGCSHWTPVKKCLDAVERDTQNKTEMSLCKTLWWWE